MLIFGWRERSHLAFKALNPNISVMKMHLGVTESSMPSIYLQIALVPSFLHNSGPQGWQWAPECIVAMELTVMHAPTLSSSLGAAQTQNSLCLNWSTVPLLWLNIWIFRAHFSVSFSLCLLYITFFTIKMGNSNETVPLCFVTPHGATVTSHFSDFICQDEEQIDWKGHWLYDISRYRKYFYQTEKTISNSLQLL